MKDIHYKITFGAKVHNSLERIAIDLGISFDQVLAQSAALYIAAIEADEVKLITNGVVQKVLLKDQWKK